MLGKPGSSEFVMSIFSTLSQVPSEDKSYSHVRLFAVDIFACTLQNIRRNLRICNIVDLEASIISTFYRTTFLASELDKLLHVFLYLACRPSTPSILQEGTQVMAPFAGTSNMLPLLENKLIVELINLLVDVRHDVANRKAAQKGAWIEKVSMGQVLVLK